MKYKLSFFVINHTSVGGVERVTSRLISLFKQNQLDVFSIISFAKEDVKNKMIDFETKTIVKTIRKKEIVQDLQDYINKEGITHLIFQGDNMSISKNILQATKNTNCKAFLHYHGSPYAYLKKNFYWSDIKEKPVNLLKLILEIIVYPIKKHKLKTIINNSKDGFITVGNGVRKELSFLYKNNDNIITIHNPTSFNNTEIDILNKNKTIVFASRLVRKHKNAMLSLKVWKLLHLKHPNWKLQILGYGVISKKMDTYIVKYNLTNVKIFGYVNNVDKFIRKSSISIVTSDSEGFSMFAYESISFKNPIVSTKSYGGISDMITDKYNGFFSPKNDEKQMAINLEKLMINDSLRIEMGNNSYTNFLELKNEDIFSQWKELLKI